MHPRSARKSRHKPINLSRGAFAQLAAALGLAMLTQSALADWTLRDSTMQEQQGLTLNTWDMQQGLSTTNRTGKLITVPTRDILYLSSGRSPVSDPASRAWRLSLRNGDVLYGDAMGMTGKNLKFKIPELGTLAIPLKRVETLTCPVYGPASSGDRTKRVPSSPDHDLVVFRQSGDKLEGLISAIGDTSLDLLPDGAEQPTPISLTKVETIVFGGAKAPRTIPPLSVRLSFVSGSVYTIPLEGEGQFAWSISKVTLKDAAGVEHSANTDRIVSAEILGGRVVYLTELDFASQEQNTFLGTSWPAQINRNCLGQPMKVAGITYDRGIGVHTQSNLVYELDGSFDTLTLRVGLDDSAAPLGEAKVAIMLDGKTLWPSDGTPRLLKPGQISEELSLPIKGGKRLELSATPTDHLDVQGRVDWLNVALRRK